MYVSVMILFLLFSTSPCPVEMLPSQLGPLALVAALVMFGLTDVGAMAQEPEREYDAAAGADPGGEPQPAEDPGPVNVTVGLTVTDVYYDLNVGSVERRQVTDTATVTGWLTAEWTDASLVRHGSAGGYWSFYEINWIPDIRPLNTVDPSANKLLKLRDMHHDDSDTVVVVDNESGKVFFQSFVQLKVRFVPSKDTFKIRLGSRRMTTAEMQLTPAGDTLDMSEYTGLPVTSSAIVSGEFSRTGFAEPFSVIEATITVTESSRSGRQ